MAIKGTLADMSLRLLQDGQYSDMTITCKDRTWKCHRNMLCVRCPFFEAACNGNFKEAKTMVINLGDDDPEGVDVLLEYLYTLAEPNFKKIAGKSHIRAEQAFILGDKYCLSQLQIYGREKLYEGIKDDFKFWDKKTAVEKQEMVDRIKRIWTWQQDGVGYMRELCLERLRTMAVSMLEDKLFANLVWENRVFGTAFMKYIFITNRR